jgi:hypothetical protein
MVTFILDERTARTIITSTIVSQDLNDSCRFGSSPEDSPLLLDLSVEASTPFHSHLNEVASPGGFRSGDSTDCGEEGPDRFGAVHF